MNTDKKRGSFQITSVTLDFDRASLESSYKAAFSDCTNEPPQQPAGNSLTTGGQGSARSTSPNPELPSACLGTVGSKNVKESVGSLASSPSSPPFGAGNTAAGLAGAVEGSCGGPALLDVPRAGLYHLSFSQPCSPLSVRKQVDLEQGGASCWLPMSSPQSPSRFRVVRLGQGLGEPYCRGRWTCTDFLERDGLDRGGLQRVMESMRHAHSLDSLEVEGFAMPGGEGPVFRPLVQVNALNTRHMVSLPGAVGMLAPDVKSSACCAVMPEGEGTGDSLAGHPAVIDSPSPLPMDQFRIIPEDPSSKAFISLIPGFSLQHQPDPFSLLSTSRLLPLSQRAGRNLPLLQLDQKVKPDSLATPQKQDGGFYHDVGPNHAQSTFSLAQSMFGAGGAFDLGSESGSSKSMMAIDNKIEQAMDLVKTHLMLAVREEVDLLREQIADLTERNSQLERENYILRTMRERD
ncbi:TSC22 domain family protein 2-like isoform X1 [Anguilla rostrata]|uniref:TSC22 domain family protein 2-like isoform X1 n=1 Tax=Anguilla rostrata TaxID=7938 RepID=UPI0030D4A1C6